MKNNINGDPLYGFCTGCQICAAVCPKDAITIKLNKEGFYRPYINENKCVDCGICRQYCYKCNQVKEKCVNVINTYAVQAKDFQLVQNSTSGGAAGIFVDELLKWGYQIVGVGYDYKKNIAVTQIATTQEETAEFQGSKYMQSYTLDAFKNIVLSKNVKYAVFGTPCQIYALGEWAVQTKQRERFMFIDIFCHGCPSLKLWKEYLKMYQINMKTAIFKKINFRSKDYGWHEFAHNFISEKEKKLSKRTINDPFFTLFFDNYILNDSCYTCNVRSDFKHTDIRMGDFWGSRYDLDTKGISAIVICTLKGQKLFECVKDKMRINSEVSLEEIIKEQSFGKKYVLDKVKREKTFELLDKYDMEECFKKYEAEYSFKKKIKIMLKKSVYFLPVSIRLMIKKIYHMK